MERYAKIMVENYRSQEKSLRRNPLHVRILLYIAIKARRTKARSIEGVDQGEFFLSETQYETFGLKKGQKWQINRAITKLIQARFIEKVEGKKGSKWWYVYKVLDWCPFQPSFQNEEQIRERAGSKQGTSRDEISKEYINKKITEMNFEEQVQAYTAERHDEFVAALGSEKTLTIKNARFKQFK